jgi:type II/III secretion system protein
VGAQAKEGLKSNRAGRAENIIGIRKDHGKAEYRYKSTLREGDDYPSRAQNHGSAIPTFSVSKVPLLGDIPWLGHLFSSRFTSDAESTLFIFIRRSSSATMNSKT